MRFSKFATRFLLTIFLIVTFIISSSFHNEVGAKQKLCPKITTKRDCAKFEKCKWAKKLNKCVGKNAANKKGTKKKCKSFVTAKDCKAQSHCNWKHTANLCRKKK